MTDPTPHIKRKAAASVRAGKPAARIGAHVELLTTEKVTALVQGYTLSKYPTPKWIQFTVAMQTMPGVFVWAYVSQSSVSKYLYVSNGKDEATFKVRFSTHKPHRSRQNAGFSDCDFFVGIHRKGSLRTEVLIQRLRKYYTGENHASKSLSVEVV